VKTPKTEEKSPGEGKTRKRREGSKKRE